MKIINNWTLQINNLPAYSKFNGIFNLNLNYELLDLCNKSNEKDFTEDRKKLLLPVLEKVNKKTNQLKVKHNQRFGVGRFYPDNSISPIAISRHIKHTLFHFLNWIDLDMVKGHPSIIFNIAQKNNINLPCFKTYLDNPKNIFDMLIEYYTEDNEPKLTEDNVKDIFNISIYGGGHTTWIKQMEDENIKLRTKTPHQFVNEFIKECREVMDLVYLNNKDLVNKVKGNLTDEHAIKCRTMSYWCGAIENDIIYLCYKFLVKNGVILDKQNVILEYDGICYQKREGQTDEFLNEILNQLNHKILKETGLNIIIKWKAYKNIYQITEN